MEGANGKGKKKGQGKGREGAEGLRGASWNELPVSTHDLALPACPAPSSSVAHGRGVKRKKSGHNVGLLLGEESQTGSVREGRRSSPSLR
jgi:hypothetical protein